MMGWDGMGWDGLGYDESGVGRGGGHLEWSRKKQGAKQLGDVQSRCFGIDDASRVASALRSANDISASQRLGERALLRPRASSRRGRDSQIID